MGTVMSVLPLFYLVAKLGTGILVDLHRNYRKCIFLALIILTALFYSIVYIISLGQLGSANLTLNSLTLCNDTVSILCDLNNYNKNQKQFSRNYLILHENIAAGLSVVKKQRFSS
jgi:hypothetical protein